MSTAKRPVLNSRVIVDPELFPQYPGVWIVTRHLPKNVELTPEANPTGRKLRISPFTLKDAPPAGTVPAMPVATVVRLDVPLHHATVVTVDSPTWKQPREWLWIVLGQSTSAKGDIYRIARLGGTDGFRYWRVPRKFLTVVAPERITIADA